MKRILLPLVLSVSTHLAHAQIFQIDDIRIDGLQRVSAGSVFTALPVSVGDLIDDEGVQRATRSLFATGYFDDIRIARDGSTLVIYVRERPAVAEITFEGNKAIKTDQLLQALRDNGLAEGQIFRQSILEGMTAELKRQYVGQGRYGAEVETNVEQLPQNRVAIRVDVNEGDIAKIKHINIVGNNAFDEDELLDLFELRESGWFTWMSGRDKYAREKLSADLDRLESWYLDRGFLQFEIESTQVSISPGRDKVYLTVNIREGDVYTIDEIELAGDPIISEQEVLNLVTFAEGDVFSQTQLTTTNNIITERLGNEGYTFAEVRGFPEVNEADKTAKITFFINPGQRAYVRRIEFRGNTKTADEVLRREMRQMEGASASGQQIEQSKIRLERLGFFREVEVETVEVPGTNDQVDVVYTVEEQPSGSIGASVGYAQGLGMVLGANLQENNFLGTGKQVGINLNRSVYRTSIGFSYVDPYFTRDGVSAGFDVFYRSTDYGELNVAEYTTDSFGGNVNFQYPLSETQRVGIGFGYENLSIDLGSWPMQEIRDFVEDNGDQYNILTTNFSWVQSTLNRGVLPDRGYSQRANLEVSIPMGDADFYRLTYAGQYFLPLGKDFTLRFRTDLGYGDSYGSTSKLPFFKNFYGGGFGSVRGFERNTLGPRGTPTYPAEWDVDSDPFGGNVLIEGSIELIFPTPFIKDRRSVQTAFFFDAGNVFDTDCGSSQLNCFSPDIGELRYSVGIGGTWLTGFGPISVSFGRALNASSEDEREFFQFSLGQTF